jgi:hypothetical protein
MSLRLIGAAAFGVAAMAGFSVGAGAAPTHEACPVGAGQTGTASIGAWEAMDEATLAAAMQAAGGDPSQAAAEFAKYNRNGDSYLCVMTQVLPNDASGFDTWFISRDNNTNAASSR